MWVDPSDGSYWSVAVDAADHDAVEFWQSRDGGASWRGPYGVAQIVSPAPDVLVPYSTRTPSTDRS